jgi:hypothetical protein
MPLRKHQEKLTHNLLSKPGEKQEKLVVKNTRQKLHLGQMNQGTGSATPEKRGQGLVKKVLDPKLRHRGNQETKPFTQLFCP